MFILISIGGWHNSHQDDPSFHTTPAFSAVAATQSAREAFVSGCINLFIKPGYPGLGRLFDGVVKGFLQTGLLSQRRVLGVNTYGKTYAGVPKINNGLYQTYTGAGPGSYGTAGEITYSDVVSWFLEITGHGCVWIAAAWEARRWPNCSVPGDDLTRSFAGVTRLAEATRMPCPIYAARRELWARGLQTVERR